MTKKATRSPKEPPRHDSDALLQLARRNGAIGAARTLVTPAVVRGGGADVLVSPRPRRRNKKRKRRNKMRAVESNDTTGAGVAVALPPSGATGTATAAIGDDNEEEEEDNDDDDVAASVGKRLKQEATVTFADSASCGPKDEPPMPRSAQAPSSHSAPTGAASTLDEATVSPAKQDTLEPMRADKNSSTTLSNSSSSDNSDDHAPVDHPDVAPLEPRSAATTSHPPLLPLASDLSIGAAMYDITGPAAEVGMFGYAKAGQLTSGIHMRLRARAFAFHDRVSDTRCVYVVADVGMVSEWVRQAVVTRLAVHAALPRGAYSLENVMISATHTHCSPGGTSHYFIYSMHPPLRGADRQNFECVVTGIVEAIVRAHRNLQPAIVRVATGECLGASVNRSEDAYMANPVEERRKYAHDTDKEMTLWRFDGVNGFPIGMINWFAVHPTSMGNWYTLITGDNKGYAAHMFEKEHGTNHLMDRPRAFVAAFAQSNEGDVSPNICGPRHCTTQHKDFERMLLVANAQLTTARSLYAQAASAPALTGGIRTAHQYVEYGKIELSPKWHVHRECPPSTSSGCIGVSMMGGTTFDGRGVKAIPEGVTWGDYPKLTTLPQLQGFQKEKPIFFPTARYGLSPAVLPLQLFVIADRLPIAAAPFEITTMAGRRLRAALHDVFRDLGREGVYEPVISGLSNAYCGYLTTREEYAVQRYEGASTHFGPNQLCATCQQFEVLARAICAAETSGDASASVVATLPPPRVNGVGVWDWNFPVLHDGLLNNTAYGHVVPDTDVLKEYRPGSTATVSFHAAHPKNNLRTQGTFLEVHRWMADASRSDGGVWVMHADDGDANTVFHWRRQGAFASVVTVEWWILPSTPAGKYRIKVNGDYKQFFSRKIQSYSGVSSTFDVVIDAPLATVKREDDDSAALEDLPSSLS